MYPQSRNYVHNFCAVIGQAASLQRICGLPSFNIHHPSALQTFLITMIPSKRLTPREFAKRYPHSGSVDKARGNHSRNINAGCKDESLSILNDIPTRATSYLVYETKILRTFRGDDTYPIPEKGDFQQLRKLKSLEAVVKEISPAKSVFSHMLVSPDDIVAIFGEEFRKTLETIQKDVS